MAESNRPAARRPRRWIYLVGVLAFLAYAGWIMGPYLRSIIVRDATVTAWLDRSTSPIDGRVEELPLGVGQAVGAEGIVARIVNPHLSYHEVEEHQSQVALALARMEELEVFLDEIQLLDEQRASSKGDFAETFRAQLDVEILSLERKIKLYGERLQLMRAIAGRKQTLARQGNAAQSSADEDAIRVSNLEFELAGLHERLNQAWVRRDAAEKGVFLDRDGEDPQWVLDSRMELKLEKKRARLELRQAQAELQRATLDVEAAQKDFERLSRATLHALPGSIVWSEPVARGDSVVSGQTVVSWLDCSKLMIDVPLADAEVSLIRPGMEAEVILEGESQVRSAWVLLTRGSGATLDRRDLASVAKGRHEGAAQVLLDFAREAGGFAECPVGRGAYVDFLDVGLIDVIRARLRL